MKLKKLALNAIAMEYSEMKQIKAGSSEGDAPCFFPENDKTRCASSDAVCTTVDGKKGSCTLHVHVDTSDAYEAWCYCHAY